MQAILECKQCGGQLSPEENQKIVYCKFCGSANAISVADRFGLYNRANYLRRQNEFDRAMGIYEDIIKEDPTDAEAYFGMALCKYGIEYVDDPETDKKVPTCHRTRFTLMSQDEDFKKAIEYADSDTLSVYMEEATKIDIILKKIQQLSSKQEKYDVFICYKESDANGDRTQTSVLAQDIYEHLTNKGYKTFFARKTLESKLGSDYEPVIFSALYSAKVMLVIGTKPEEFQAVWVRNEWVRFMERISNADECTLIPLYRDMSPYELPNELANIQALDIGKIGYIQDLLDGIGKLVKKSSHEGTAISGAVAMADTSVNVSGLRKRAFLFLEQGDFKSASQYFERVLDQNPEDSESYWGKLLAKLECHAEEDIENVSIPIKEMQNFQMAMRFGTEEQKEKYKRYSDLIDSKLYEEAKRIAEESRLQEEKRAKKEAEIKHIREEKSNKIKKVLIKYGSIIAIIVAIWISTTDSGRYDRPNSSSTRAKFTRFYTVEVFNYEGKSKKHMYIKLGNNYLINGVWDLKATHIEGRKVIYYSNLKQGGLINMNSDSITEFYKGENNQPPRFHDVYEGDNDVKIKYCRPGSNVRYYEVWGLK